MRSEADEDAAEAAPGAAAAASVAAAAVAAADEVEPHALEPAAAAAAAAAAASTEEDALPTAAAAAAEASASPATSSVYGKNSAELMACDELLAMLKERCGEGHTIGLVGYPNVRACVSCAGQGRMHREQRRCALHCAACLCSRCAS